MPYFPEHAGRMRDPRRRDGTYGALLALAVSLVIVATGPVRAEPDPCREAGSSPVTYNCKGNQSGGVNVRTETTISPNTIGVRILDLDPLPNNAPYREPFVWRDINNLQNFHRFEIYLDDIDHVVGTSSNVIFTSRPRGAGTSGSKIDLWFNGTGENSNGNSVLTMSTDGQVGLDGVNGTFEEPNGRGGKAGGDGRDAIVNLSNRTAFRRLPTFIRLTQPGQGAPSPGIVAESHGANGGNGYDFAVSKTDGGNGGDGGSAGLVELRTTELATISGYPEAISLTTIGGNGGSGGDAGSAFGLSGRGYGGRGGKGGDSLGIRLSGDTSGLVIDAGGQTAGAPAIALTSQGGHGGDTGASFLAAGGRAERGGAGGDGGPIDLEDQDRVITLGAAGGATALTALSEGGMGGKGGDGDQNDYPGPGGLGGDGGSMTFSGAWDVTAIGAGNRGLVADSIGGQGGDSGKISGIMFGQVVPGGDGGDGGAIAIITRRPSSIVSDGTAIAFRSIGGEGGRSNNQGFGTGPGGPGGAGGALTFGVLPNGQTSAAAWNLHTSAASGHGISLVTQGGEGGEGVLQANGGAGGSGGDITIAQGTRTIRTNGVDAYGVLASSVGGRGGTSNNTTRGKGGDGGAIFAAGDFDIATTGSGAHGLVARSFGGAAGASGGGNGPGAGGDISIVLAGAGIAATGNGAHGIVAESRAGTAPSTGAAAAGDVEIDVEADISAGPQGIGIIAESTPRRSGAAGDFDIVVFDGVTVSGGAGGAGIELRNGATNLITNGGTITAESTGETPVAIRAVGNGQLEIRNFGTIDGSIVEDAQGASSGRSVLKNEAGGVIVAGARIETDRFVNNGVIVAADEGRVGETLITGELIEMADSISVFDITSNSSGLRSAGDEITVQGDAFLNGALVASYRLGRRGAVPDLGPQDITVVAAGGSLTLGPEFDVEPSVVAQYRSRKQANSLVLHYDVDFENDTIRSAANGNQERLTWQLARLFGTGALSSEAAPTTEALIGLSDVGDYLSALDSLGGELYSSTQVSTLVSARGFADQLMSCTARGLAADAPNRFLRDGQCFWFSASGERFRQSSTGNSLGFDVNGRQVAGGVEVTLDSGWHLGFAGSFGSTDISMDSSASANGPYYQAGAVVKRDMGPWQLSAALSGGAGDFDTSRTLFVGEKAKGNQDVWNISARLRAARTFEGKNWFVNPRLDLGIDRVGAGSVSEKGTEGFDLRVSGSAETYYSISPAVEMGSELVMRDGTLLRPSLTLGVTQFLGDAQPASENWLEVAGSSGGSFRSETTFDKTYLDVAIGVDIFASERMTAKLSVFGSFSENTTTAGGAARIEFTF